MLDPPQHDWSYFEAATRESNEKWLRELTTSERFALTASLFNTIWNARENLPGDWQKLDNERWSRKLAERQRMVEAFRKLDELRRERSAGNDSN